MTYAQSALVARLSDCSRSRSVAMMMILASANVLAWLWAWTIFRGNPALLGAAMLAYGLGLRHALDADHIAVIDEGRIVEFGNHPTLLARDGLYAELFRQQQLEEEIEAL